MRSNVTWLSALQWLALVAMLQEHVTRYLFPASDFLPWSILLGRLAFPIFAALVAYHVHRSPDAGGYIRRLLVIALVAQVPYMLLIDPSRMNVIVTLALGAQVARLITTTKVWPLVAAALVVALAAAADPVLEYGLAGVLVVPLILLSFRAPALVHLSLLIALSFLLLDANGLSIVFQVVAMLGALLVILQVRDPALRFQFDVPRIPPLVWRAFYPVHLVLITAIKVAI